ncbi:MAG TPA: FMN-binding negative transcriptional regulator [Chitinophagaceae bacterium]|nr:FMN-binding negative transcriptional regulator [Chitinophagaceae bacterium]
MEKSPVNGYILPAAIAIGTYSLPHPAFATVFISLHLQKVVMYSLPHFMEKDEQKVLQFMKEHPFAFLIANSQPYPATTQVPLLTEEREGKLYLKGHIMRQTDHHKAFVENPHVLCVFTGPHSYISASWYTNPGVVSTWNYMSVHAKGELRFLGEHELMDILKETTEMFENGHESPASFHNLSEEYVQRLSKAIIGFEVAVEKLDHVFKLSQNRDRSSYENIILKLGERGYEENAMADEMKKRVTELFD